VQKRTLPINLLGQSLEDPKGKALDRAPMLFKGSFGREVSLHTHRVSGKVRMEIKIVHKGKEKEGSNYLSKGLLQRRLN